MEANVVSVLVQKKHGVLIKLYARLKSSGYVVTKHEVKPSTDDALEIVDFYVTGTLPLSDAAVAEISDLPEFENFLAGAASSGGSSNAAVGREHTVEAPTVELVDTKLLAQKFAGRVYGSYPDVQGILQEAGASVDPSERSTLLRNIGVYVGGAMYKEEYSLGLPMKIEPYMKRAIALSLKPIGDITIKGNTLNIIGSNCCAPSVERSQCDFIFGLVQGLVLANKATKGVTVDRVACLTTSDAVCTFMFS